MRIICPPVLVGDRICRIVSPIESLLEVEEWRGEWWEPSSVTITLASQSSPAPEALLCERGVPLEDSVTAGERTEGIAIQALMRGREPVDVAQVSSAAPPGLQTHGTRRKEYTGNARFRRGATKTARAGLDRTDLRRTEPPAEWSGPWRRASDAPHVARPDGQSA